MRVAVVTESFLPTMNGVTNSVLRVLDHLDARGHEAIVVCPGPAPESYLDFPVREVTSLKVWHFPLGMPTAHVAQTLEDFEPDVAHVASPVVLGGIALAACQRLDVPTVSIYQSDIAGFALHHGLPRAASRVLWDWARQLHEMADLTLAPSNASVADLRAHGVPRVELWGRGVDTVRFTPARREGAARAAVRRRIDPEGEDVVIGYVGRLFPEKRVERLAALAGVPGVRLAIVGDGPSRGSVERALAVDGLRTTFLGMLGGDELADAYAAFDVFVHTGTEETFGQTLQEAMATRLPVVAPGAGGPVDIVRHGETGYLYSPEDDGDLRRRVVELAGDPVLRERMGEAARRVVLTRSWEAVCDQLLGYYQRAMAEHAATDRRQAIDLGGLAAATLSLRQ
ncbi:MAG: glycosyltransferase family 4 protein [Kineosporiaceae bacterium]